MRSSKSTRPSAAALAFVPLEEDGDLGRGPRRVPPRRLGGGLVAVGPTRRALAHSISVATSAASSALAAPPGQHRHEEARLALEQLRHRPVVVLTPAPELRQRDGVERARGDLAADPEPGEAIAELAGGLARERDRERVRRVDVGVPGLPGDATGQDARLARAGAGEDRERYGAAS